MVPQNVSLDDETRSPIVSVLDRADAQLASKELVAARESYVWVRERAQRSQFNDLVARADEGLRRVANRHELEIATAAVQTQQWDVARTRLNLARASLDAADANAVAAYGAGMRALARQKEAAGQTAAAIADLDAALAVQPQDEATREQRNRLAADLRKEQRTHRLKLAGVFLAVLFVVGAGLGAWRALSGGASGRPTATPALAAMLTQTAQAAAAAAPATAGPATAEPPTAVPPTATAPTVGPTQAIPSPKPPSGTPRPTASQSTSEATRTATPSPSTTLTARPAPPTATRTPEPTALALSFAGAVQRTNGERMAGFAQVELWGAIGLEAGTVALDAKPADKNGEFVLRTNQRFDAYVLWVRPQDGRYRPVGVTAGPGATPVGSQAVRYVAPAGGLHSGNVFVIGNNTPTPSPTLPASPTRPPSATPTATVQGNVQAGRLSPVTLLAPAPDFTSADLAEFAWKLPPGLPSELYAEVVMWREGERPVDARGVAGALRAERLPVHLASVPWVKDGTYFWTVIIVRVNPYERLTQPSAGRRLFVNVGRTESAPSPGPICPPGGC